MAVPATHGPAAPGQAVDAVRCRGQGQKLPEPRFPVELPYESRTNPAPPESGELVVDITLRYRRAGVLGIHDVQWRQRLTWGAQGASAVDLRHTLPG